jgi:hypothetical protein
MSLRRPPPDEEELLVAVLDEEELLELELLVEYFVEVLEELSCVFTSVPKSVHSSQTSSSAPSILTRFGSDVSFPHISH